MGNYILQKDLPDAKKGCNFHPTENGNDYVCYDNMDKWSCCYPKAIVENNEEWFLPELVKVEMTASRDCKVFTMMVADKQYTVNIDNQYSYQDMILCFKGARQMGALTKEYLYATFEDFMKHVY